MGLDAMDLQGLGVSPGKALGQTKTADNGSSDSTKPKEATDPGEQLVDFPAPKGHGAGCGHCMPASLMGGKVKAKDLQQLKQASLQEVIAKVIAHEMAHQSGAGGLAGPMSIKVGSDGSVAGEVPIQMPGINLKNLAKTIADAGKVIAGALAPGDPSAQDYAVASQARALLAEAQSLQSSGKGQPEEGKKPQFSLSA